MIFVILGTQKFQLNRLLKCIDSLYETKQLKEEVFAQIGYSDYIPQHYKYVNFLDRAKFEEQIMNSSVVITHSGVGSIITALQYEKPVIVFPRLCKYKEHVDDHQLEIAEAFAKRNYILCCNEKEELIELIDKAREYQFDKYVSSTKQIITILNDFLEKM